MHIAFIAMSGVRAASKELNEAGLTMPGFLERSKAIASLPSLALLTLAALTPDPIDVTYHEVEDIRAMGDLPDCDVAAIASYSAQIKDAYELADRYRAEGVRTVLGGLHVTARPEEALGHADAVVIGEGELGWPDARQRPAGRAHAPDVRAGRPRVRPRRRADAALRPARRGAVQPADRPDPARLPLALRVLRRVDPAHEPVQGQAGRQGHRGDPRDQAPLAQPVRRVRRRQHVRQPAPLDRADGGARGRADQVVHGDRHLGRGR